MSDDKGELVFEAEDFNALFDGMMPEQRDYLRMRCARISNGRFKAWIEAQPVVYGKDAGCDRDANTGSWAVKRFQVESDTHRARLVCVEKLGADSADAIVRDLLAMYHNFGGTSYFTVDELIERAKRLKASGPLKKEMKEFSEVVKTIKGIDKMLKEEFGTSMAEWIDGFADWAAKELTRGESSGEDEAGGGDGR